MTERVCAYCGAALVRRANEGGSKFRVRKTCGAKCANELMSTNNNPNRKVVDIDEFCARYERGEPIAAIANYFGIGKRTVDTFGVRYATPAQRENRKRRQLARRNPRNAGKSKPKEETVIHLKIEPTDWTGVKFTDDPAAIADGELGKAPGRPATHVPTQASAA